MFTASAKATVRSVRAAEQQVVKSELRAFEATRLPATSMPARSRTASHAALSDSSDTDTPTATSTAAAAPPQPAAAAAGSTRSTRPEQMQRLLQVPFTGAVVHGERSALDEAQQVYDAVAWLRECPSGTLRQLQQRVLCATEQLFTQLVGMPAAVRQLLLSAADPRSRERLGDEDRDEQAADPSPDVYLNPPPSLSFTEFLGTFVRDTGATAGTSLDGVLCSGRPQPAAPLSSLHLVYGLHVVEDALRPPASATPASPATSLESHPALMSEVVHWARFFEGIFDKAREGLCRDPVNFYVAVLLACAERGAWELHNTPDAIAEEAVRRLQLDDGTTGRRPHNCGACEAEAAQLATRCRTYVHRTLQTLRYGDAAASITKNAGRSRRGKAAPLTRFFLATPAVVWWAAVFLRLYRLRTPVMAATHTPTSSAPPSRATADDVVSSAEVYFMRDWIARAAKQDADGFKAQETSGGFAVPLSCATRAPVAVFGFTHDNVQTALSRLSVLGDAAVASGTSVRVEEVLALLQDDFPVVPYYLSYFKED